MSDIAIKVERLSKIYKIGRLQKRHDTLRDRIADARVLNLFKRRNGHVTGDGRRVTDDGQSSVLGPRSSVDPLDTLWALKDVSFEVKRGEVVGIIGRNGAGKSTLLKILSRITEPTEGYADINGRVASLLEVGTGFHPELTGRENIYLNGSILGMKRTEIERKFDEIVDFAGIEKFIDTPVKRYSSGMHVRLAFAVSAHLDPEILLVDEVLSVGDAAFQKKCLGKIGDVAKEGRTVLFVSHNMVAVAQLCERCVWIDSGRIELIGDPRNVIGQYLKASSGANGRALTSNQVVGDGRVELKAYEIRNHSGTSEPPPTTKEDLSICVKMHVHETISEPAYGVSVVNESGILMTSINTVEQGLTMPSLAAGDREIRVKLSSVSFLPGLYFASFWVMNPQGHIYAHADNQLAFELAQSALYGTRQLDHRWGCVYTKVDFTP